MRDLYAGSIIARDTRTWYSISARMKSLLNFVYRIQCASSRYRYTSLFHVKSMYAHIHDILRSIVLLDFHKWHDDLDIMKIVLQNKMRDKIAFYLRLYSESDVLRWI